LIAGTIGANYTPRSPASATTWQRSGILPSWIQRRKKTRNPIWATRPGSTASYTYDAFGLRAEKIVGSRTTDYLYDAFGNASNEVNNLCAPVCIDTDFLYLGGQLVAEYKEGLTYFVHTDHIGSARLVTGLNQTVAQNLDYLPFGEQNSTDSGISTNEFTGDIQDAESDLDHAQFRQYSSSLGRWMHPDPAGLAAVDPTNPQSLNRYTYVLNNPLALIDPSGLNDCINGYIGCNCNEDESDCSHDFFGPGNPGNGCNPSDVSCVGIGGGIGIGVGIGLGGGGNPPQTGGGTNPPIPPPNNPGTTFPGIPIGQIACVSVPPGAPPICLRTPWPAWLIALVAGGGASVAVVPAVASALDNRANALAQAINNTRVQSLGNPCTVVAWYGTSAALGFGGGAVAGGEAAGVGSAVAEASAPYWPTAFSWLYRQAMNGFPVIRFLTGAYNKTTAAVQTGCNALQ